MARRKRWSDLSPAYRRRLERRGVTAQTHAHPAPRRRRPSEYERLSGTFRARMRRAGIGREEYLAGYGLGRLPPVPRGPRVHELALRVGRGEPLQGVALREADRVRVAVPWLAEHDASIELAVVLYDQLADPTTGHWREVVIQTDFSARPIDLVITYDDGSTRTVEIPAQLFDDLYYWLDSFGPEGVTNDLGWSWEVSYG